MYKINLFCVIFILFIYKKRASHTLTNWLEIAALQKIPGSSVSSGFSKRRSEKPCLAEFLPPGRVCFCVIRLILTSLHRYLRLYQPCCAVAM